MFPLSMRRGDDGARHRDKSATARDIEVLEKALAVEADPYMIARYMMYLGNTYDDLGDYSKAIDCYLKRADLGCWDQEIYMSLLMAAVNVERLEGPNERALGLYDRAIRVIPTRAEARHGASRCCRHMKDFAAGYRYAEAARSLTMPSEGISLNPWVYQYGVLEELAFSAYQIGQYRVCLSACLEILGQAHVPADLLARSSALAGRALAKMVDPVWGCQPSPYRSEYVPAWQV